MPVCRPAPYLEAIAIMAPLIALVIASVLLLNEKPQAPNWMPLLILVVILLIFIPLLIVTWLFMQSVRLSPSGIAVGRPFQRWREAPWQEIVRAKRSGMFLHFYTSSGASIAFAPRLLTDGDRLITVILDHLAPHILVGSLRAEALDQMEMDEPESDVMGMLRVRPRGRWPFSGFALALAGISGAVIALFLLPLEFAIALSLLGVVVALFGVAAAVWLLQEVILMGEGLTIIQPWRRSPVELAWGEIKVLDHSANWLLLRFRAGRSVRCIGPALLRGPERVRMLAFINHYCLDRDVLNYPHRWPFF
ncbi:MAG TPA: hypothetical protein VFX24_12625 [Ktedonobacterales bacterium]|jgi:hypothetical protein|nr:hypothetical protein [Ktedonobacterales bacterium]